MLLKAVCQRVDPLTNRQPAFRVMQRNGFFAALLFRQISAQLDLMRFFMPAHSRYRGHIGGLYINIFGPVQNRDLALGRQHRSC